MIYPMASEPQEQAQLREDLTAEYGEALYGQAVEFSGLALCLTALATDDMTTEERAEIYQQASLHLSALLAVLLPPGTSQKLTECAKRLDAATEIWMADEMARRAGL